MRQIRKSEDYPYTQLGRLIVIHNMMEAALAMLLVQIAGLSNAGIAVPLVNTLEYKRKCELLKAFATVFPQRKAELRKIAELAEKVGGKRNMAAHSVIGHQSDGQAVFLAMGGARAIRREAGKPMFTVSDIADVSRQAGELHRLILSETKLFETNHAIANAVRQAATDPEQRDRLMDAIVAAMESGRGETEPEPEPEPSSKD